MQKFDNCVGVTFSVINIVVPFLFAVTLLGFNLKDLASFRDDPTKTVTFPFWGGSNFIMLYLNGLVQLVSGGYIGYAVYMIRAHIKTEDSN